MSKESFVFMVGVIVFFTPFLGLPGQYKEVLIIACGVLLVIVGYRLRRRAFLKSLEHESGERRGDAFVESGAMMSGKNPLGETDDKPAI